MTNLHRDFAVMAVQGTESDEVLTAAGLPAGHDYMSFVEVDRDGLPITVCRTGYTGERGYELLVPVAAAGGVWDALARCRGSRTGCSLPVSGRGTRCGPRWATRCTARTSPRASPRSRPGSAGRWAGPRNRFFGDAALRAEKAAGPARMLRGLKAVGRGIPRPGMTVAPRRRRGRRPGDLRHVLPDPEDRHRAGAAGFRVAEDDVVNVDIRGRSEPFVVTKPPFVTPGVRES